MEFHKFSVASHADVLGGSSRVPALRTSAWEAKISGDTLRASSYDPRLTGLARLPRSRLIPISFVNKMPAILALREMLGLIHLFQLYASPIDKTVLANGIV